MRPASAPEEPVDTEHLRRFVRDIPDFPKPGILFRDVTPLLLEPEALRAAALAIAAPFRELGIDRVLGIESRGFLLGAPVALELGVGLGLVRKKGKLPYRTHQVSYDLEYGTDTVEMHVDAVSEGHRVLIVDDLVATGGTAAASIRLARGAGGVVVGCSFLIELAELGGTRLLDVEHVHSVIRY
jgi:adenine phosphoribosyltransferase